MSWRLSSALFVLAVLCISAPDSFARTWYVAENGSGDAPTISAAIDSSSSGDNIVVGPGNYPVGSIDTGGLILKAGTTLTSELGPVATVLFAADGPLQSGVIGTSNNCTVNGLTLSGGQNASLSCTGNNVQVSNNIIHGRLHVIDVTIVHNNLVILTGAGSQAVLIANAPVQFFNNIVLGEVAFDVPGCAFNVTAYCNLIQEGPTCFGVSYANFSADPLFCGVGNYYLRADSPCAAGNSHGGVSCGQIGPLPIGCGTVNVEAKTWGAVKAMYRK